MLLAVALSIGPVTAILSVGNWLLWRPHPGVADARSLAVVWFGQWRQNGASVSFSPSGVSYDKLADIRSRARSITGIAGVQESSSSLGVPGRLPRQAGTALVTADFLDALGVTISAGRSFTPDEDRGPFGSPVVVISHGLARSAFGSAQDALGKSIALNSQPFSIIGVAPPTFVGISSTGGIDAWVTGPSSVRETLFDRGRQREIERAQVEIQLLPTRGAHEHAGNLRAVCFSAPHPYVMTPRPSGETFRPVRPSVR